MSGEREEASLRNDQAYMDFRTELLRLAGRGSFGSARWAHIEMTGQDTWLVRPRNRVAPPGDPGQVVSVDVVHRGLMHLMEKPGVSGLGSATWELLMTAGETFSVLGLTVVDADAVVQVGLFGEVLYA